MGPVRDWGGVCGVYRACGGLPGPGGPTSGAPGAGESCPGTPGFCCYLFCRGTAAPLLQGHCCPSRLTPGVRVSDGRPQPREAPRLQGPHGRCGSFLDGGSQFSCGQELAVRVPPPPSMCWAALGGTEPWGLLLTPGVAQVPAGPGPPCPVQVPRTPAGVLDHRHLPGGPSHQPGWGDASLPLSASSWVLCRHWVGYVLSSLGFASTVPSVFARPLPEKPSLITPSVGSGRREGGGGGKGCPACRPCRPMCAAGSVPCPSQPAEEGAGSAQASR